LIIILSNTLPGNVIFEKYLKVTTAQQSEMTLPSFQKHFLRSDVGCVTQLPYSGNKRRDKNAFHSFQEIHANQLEKKP
jgi:hypothetical protein